MGREIPFLILLRRSAALPSRWTVPSARMGCIRQGEQKAEKVSALTPKEGKSCPSRSWRIGQHQDRRDRQSGGVGAAEPFFKADGKSARFDASVGCIELVYRERRLPGEPTAHLIGLCGTPAYRSDSLISVPSSIKQRGAQAEGQTNISRRPDDSLVLFLIFAGVLYRLCSRLQAERFA